MSDTNITLEEVKKLYPKSRINEIPECGIYEVYPKIECCVRSEINQELRYIHFVGPSGEYTKGIDIIDEDEIHDIIYNLLISNNKSIKVQIDSRKIFIYALKIYLGILNLNKKNGSKEYIRINAYKKHIDELKSNYKTSSSKKYIICSSEQDDDA